MYPLSVFAGIRLTPYEQPFRVEFNGAGAEQIPRGEIMFRSGRSFSLTAVAGLILAMTIAARLAVAKDSKTTTASVSVLSEMTLAGK